MDRKKNRRTNGRRGFTLVELMIVVAIIGILASIAVPNFIRYQARSRRSEAYANLSGLARAEKAYQAERNEFVDSGTSPSFALPDDSLYGGLGTTKMPWDGASAAVYDLVGWAPEGQVFYTYEVNAGQFAAPCTCDLCFTATAHGDVDGDSGVSSLMYVHPQFDSNGAVTGECTPYLGGGLGTPTRAGTGQPIYDEVAVQPINDDY